LGTAVTFFQPTLTPAYMQRWSLTVQREIAGRVFVEAGYTGNRGTHVPFVSNFDALPDQYLSTSPTRDPATINSLTQLVSNPFLGIPQFAGSGLTAATVARQQLLTPFPQFTGVSSMVSNGFSWYHGAHLRMEKRLAHSYTLSAAYTWSKSMEAVNLLNPADPAPTHSISPLDRPHHIVVNGNWEMPWARKKLWGGWSLDTIYQWQSGAPIGFGDIIFNGSLANIVLPASQRTPAQWFNVNAGFNRNSAEQLANNVRTFPLLLTGLRAGHWNTWDISLVKRFPIRERLNFQLRAEAVDAFNHPLFSAPNATPTSTLFGQVTSTVTASQRQITLAGKLVW